MKPRRRTQCINNLKQLSLGVLLYLDAHNSLVPGSVGPPVKNGSVPAGWRDPKQAAYPYGYFGWSAVVLPFIEQQSLYYQINFSKAAFAESVPENSSFSNASMERGPAGDAVNMLVANSQPPVFVCPSAYRVKPENQFKDYAINGGTGACCPDRAFSDAEIRYMDGVAYVNSDIPPTAADYRRNDNTFLFLELAHWASTVGPTATWAAISSFSCIIFRRVM